MWLHYFASDRNVCQNLFEINISTKQLKQNISAYLVFAFQFFNKWLPSFGDNHFIDKRNFSYVLPSRKPWEETWRKKSRGFGVTGFCVGRFSVTISLSTFTHFQASIFHRHRRVWIDDSFKCQTWQLTQFPYCDKMKTMWRIPVMLPTWRHHLD